MYRLQTQPSEKQHTNMIMVYNVAMTNSVFVFDGVNFVLRLDLNQCARIRTKPSYTQFPLYQCLNV